MATATRILEVTPRPQAPGPTASRPDQDHAAEFRQIRYEHSNGLVDLLEHLGVSLLVSTYQAGKLFVVSACDGALNLSFHNFQQAMGVAAGPAEIAVGSQNQIWFLRSTPQIAPQLAPRGRRDACYLTRRSHFTGDIHVHEMAWAGDDLWVVGTLFSCLCTLDDEHSFVPRWRPPFITALAAEDRCHLNGLAMVDGRPQYVTALGETDAPEAWRSNKATAGCLIDVPTGETVARGFAMPHSPRVYRRRTWLLDSGAGRLVTVDPASGRADTVARLPGYTRGLAFHDSYAFVGLSQIRETSVFGGLPIAEQRDRLKCGIAVVDLHAGAAIAHLEFQSGVEEIFDVQVLPGVRSPAISGPFPEIDGSPPIWSAPADHHSLIQSENEP